MVRPVGHCLQAMLAFLIFSSPYQPKTVQQCTQDTRNQHRHHAEHATTARQQMFTATLQQQKRKQQAYMRTLAWCTRATYSHNNWCSNAAICTHQWGIVP